MLFLICMSIPRIVTNMNACPTLNFNSHRQAYSIADDGQKIGELSGMLSEVLKNEHMVADNLLQNVIPATCQVISKLLTKNMAVADLVCSSLSEASNSPEQPGVAQVLSGTEPIYMVAPSGCAEQKFTIDDWKKFVEENVDDTRNGRISFVTYELLSAYQNNPLFEVLEITDPKYKDRAFKRMMEERQERIAHHMKEAPDVRKV
jgi:hypothetical protein